MPVWALVAIAMAFTIADQLTKWWVVSHLTLHQSIPILGRALSLTYCHNPGGAFSLLPGARGFFIATGVVVSLALFAYLPRLAREPRLPAVAYAMILGGALGNLIDRALHGYVIDFIDLGWWPVFNIADCGISVGIFLLFVSLVTSPESSTDSQASSQSA